MTCQMSLTILVLYYFLFGCSDYVNLKNIGKQGSDTIMKLNENTYIVGNKVILVPYCRHHVVNYHEWMKSPELQRLTASEPLSLEEEYEMQKTWHTDENKCTFILLDKDIYDQCRDEITAMIGDTNMFLTTSNSHKEAEVEVMIAEEMSRGKRRGWEAVLLMLEYGCEILDINKFIVKIGTDNLPSLKMFHKIGFTEVSRSDVFSEVTLEKPVTTEWQSWLRTHTQSAQRFCDYSKKFTHHD